jgi:ribosomal protein S21
MANAVRVRVEVKNYGFEERDHSFKRLFTAFKKACSESSVMHECKQHETYESKSRKRRRKKRESEIQRLKSKLRENFTPQRKGNLNDK